MSELLRDTINAAERVIAGEDSTVRDYLERLLDSPGELRSAEDSERIYLAALLDFIGMHDESVRVLRDAPNAMSRNMEGMLAAAHGQHKQARNIFMQALDAATDSPLLRKQILANLAAVSLRAGSINEAEAWIEAAAVAGQAGNPAVDVLIATVRAGIASHREDLPTLRSAAATLEKASKSRLAELGTEHPQALAVVANMASTEIMVARAENSTVRLERAIDVLEVAAFRLAAELGADNPQTKTAIASLAAARAEPAPAERVTSGVTVMRTLPRSIASSTGRQQELVQQEADQARPEKWLAAHNVVVAMAEAGAGADELAANRELWTQATSEYTDERAYRAWAAQDITWGIFNVPERQLDVLGDVRGLDVVELGCGTAYFSAWLARRGARPTGVDVTPAQLESARRCQDRFGIAFPLVEADAADVPLPSGSFDLAISECGASLWCDPARWVPEAARLLRPGGKLVFHTTSILVTVCSPGPDEPADRELLHPQRQTHRLAAPRGGIQFHLGHGEWITILRDSGFVIDALHELYAPPDVPDHPYYALASAAWARQWPAEEIWAAHLAY